MALTAGQTRAIALMDAFNAAAIPWVSAFFPSLFRGAVADDIKKVIGNPALLDQGESPLCGPACFLRTIALESPEVYAQAAIDLFDRGTATIGSLTISPMQPIGSNLPTRTSQGDWLMLASLRESENSVLDVAGPTPWGLAGVTPPWELAEWFRRAGYGTVVRNTMIVPSLSLEPNYRAERARSALAANGQRLIGGRVMLLIDADLLIADEQDSFFSIDHPNHWVMLESVISDGGLYAYTAPLSCQVYSWGGIRSLPELPLSKSVSKKTFLEKFYGFIAVRK